MVQALLALFSENLRIMCPFFLTCVDIKACVVESAHEELEPDDGVDDDDEEDEQGDVHQGDNGHQDSVHHNLQA
jgi:hypothetical protein